MDVSIRPWILPSLDKRSDEWRIDRASVVWRDPMRVSLIILPVKESKSRIMEPMGLSPLCPLRPILLRHSFIRITPFASGILFMEQLWAPSRDSPVAWYFGRKVHSGQREISAQSLQRCGIVAIAVLSSHARAMAYNRPHRRFIPLAISWRAAISFGVRNVRGVSCRFARTEAYSSWVVISLLFSGWSRGNSRQPSICIQRLCIRHIALYYNARTPSVSAVGQLFPCCNESDFGWTVVVVLFESV